MKHDQQELREHLTKLLQGGQAFRSMAEILEGISLGNAGKEIVNVPYTLWQLLEHLRITQWDILEFSCNPEHQSPKWPDAYWPEKKAPKDQEALDKTIEAINGNLKVIIELVQDPGNDLYKPFAHGGGQTLLREAMLVAQHNAYHLGEVVVLRRLLGYWE